MKLLEVLKNNASKLNLLSIDAENDEITEAQLLFQLNRVIEELSKVSNTLTKSVMSSAMITENLKQNSLLN